MKIKLFVCVILIVSFSSGAVAPSQSIDTAKANLDSVIIDIAAKRYTDSIANIHTQLLDSLELVIDSLRQEVGKKKVVGRVDVWGPIWKRDTLKWWYWEYPNGDRKFIKTTKH